MKKKKRKGIEVLCLSLRTLICTAIPKCAIVPVQFAPLIEGMYVCSLPLL